MRIAVGVVVLASALFALAQGAGASIMIGANASGVALRVGEGGGAEVSWTQGGGRRVVVVRPDGSVHWGERLPGGDASQPASIDLPLDAIVRQGPDGALYAVQSWRRLKTGPIELRFSRWRGEPTRLTLDANCCKWRSERIAGYASFQGKAIFGYSSTPQGVPLDDLGRNVYLDSLRGGGWQRMMGILTHRPTGFYRLWIRPYWRGSAYRGTIIGPNWGWTLAPDARAVTDSAM